MRFDFAATIGLAVCISGTAGSASPQPVACPAPSQDGGRLPLGYQMWLTVPLGWGDLNSSQNNFGPPTGVIGPPGGATGQEIHCGFGYMLQNSPDIGQLFGAVLTGYKAVNPADRPIRTSGREAAIGRLQPLVASFTSNSERTTIVVINSSAATRPEDRHNISNPPFMVFQLVAPAAAFDVVEERFFRVLASLGGTTAAPLPKSAPAGAPVLTGHWSGPGAGIKFQDGVFERYYIRGPGSASPRDQGSYVVLASGRIRMTFVSALGNRTVACEYRMYRDAPAAKDRLDVCGEQYWRNW